MLLVLSETNPVVLALTVCVVATLLLWRWISSRGHPVSQQNTTLAGQLKSVNFHFLRQCNYSCEYCFHQDHKERTKNKLDWKAGLQELRLLGMQKINFSGGEPFLKAKQLGEMVDFCKERLGVTTGIISNGSLIKRAWMDKHGKNLDWLGISVDSFEESTLRNIGRNSGSKIVMIERLLELKQWCAEFGVLFKINTVVSRFNQHEDMSDGIAKLQPSRWKVFQALKIEGENAGPKVTRNVENSLISTRVFERFLRRHAPLNPIAESNSTMRNSYVILDEKMRFLNNAHGRKQPTRSILDVGVAAAFHDGVLFEEKEFVRRRGPEAILSCSTNPVTDIEDLLK